LCKAREHEVDDGKDKKNSSGCLVPAPHFRGWCNVDKMTFVGRVAEKVSVQLSKQKEGIQLPGQMKEASKTSVKVTDWPVKRVKEKTHALSSTQRSPKKSTGFYY
jgi:hypothetical protein